MGIFNRILVKKTKIESDEACYREAILLIKNRRFNDAYKIICQWNIKKKLYGLEVDWNKELERGLSAKDITFLNELYLLHQNIELVSNAIYVILSGVGCSDVARFICLKNMDNVNTISQQLQYITAMHSTIKEVNELIDYDEKYVIYTSTLDENTCPLCGKLDGKRIKLSEAKIGQNLPPMHEGCRCTLISGMTLKELKSTKRRFRNPQTNKNEVIPYMTYNQWKKSYMK